jgi:dihydrofolate synthase / folylpolyglutamate synthase
MWVTRTLAERVTEAIHFVYASYGRLSRAQHTGYDRDVRNPSWTRQLLDALGAPDHGGYNIAVTGSKGKGSHAILVAGVLQQMGFRVGLFTSPHLVDFLERIRLQGDKISEEDFVQAADEVKRAVCALPIPATEYIGPVGIVAAMAAHYFQRKQTDFNIFELGRGALHDDVNQVRHHGAIITPIFPEHLDRLGPTWQDVVNEKMGILTNETRWAVTYRQEDFVQDWIDQWRVTCDLDEFSVLQREFDVTPIQSNRLVIHSETGDSMTEVVEVLWKGKPLRATVGSALIPFRENVGVALVAAAMAVQDAAEKLPAQLNVLANPDIDVDLTKLSPPGRLQVVRAKPTVVIDGSIHAVNATFVQRMVEAYRMGEEVERVVCVLSLPDDKDATGVIGTLSPVVDDFLFTTSSNPHLDYTRDLTMLTGAFSGQVENIRNVNTAFATAMERTSSRDMVLCVGTQSFVGDALRYFTVPTRSLWI